MTPVETLILVLYFFVLSILAIYGWHRYYLVYLYMKNKGKAPAAAAAELTDLPRVTVQLPDLQRDVRCGSTDRCGLRNGLPSELLEIQVLDDSTDETTYIAELAVRRHARARLRHPLHAPRGSTRIQGRARSRPDWPSRRGEFIAIFDADFIPPTDFLQRTLPYFFDRPKIGMVQARWGHINQDYSLLTKIQSILLDAHFVLEHGGAQPRRVLLQLQRHGWCLAPRSDRRPPAAGSTTR